MFDHRLGLALGKSLAEIRALPYREYRSWQIFELLEPWGWPDREYRTAVLLAMLYNTNISKKQKARNAKDFMRDMQDLIARELAEKPDIESLSKEQIIALVKRDLGIR